MLMPFARIDNGNTSETMIQATGPIRFVNIHGMSYEKDPELDVPQE